RSEVDRGLLASLYLDTDMRRLGRRVALHVQRILAGEDAGGLPVDFRRNRRLTLNMATARAIGAHPDWRVITEAELLHSEPPTVGRRLSLASAAREAVTANLDLAAADRSVAAGRQAVRAARAALRPQITASGGAETIDRDRAKASFGLQPVWTSAGSVGVAQVLYSDGARARASIERHVQTSREQAREELRLDVAHEATVGYLDVLRARTFERIERDNLTLTRSNLELAQSRRRIGVARASEVIRWENQIAINRRAVIQAGAVRSVVEMALNRLLHRPLEEPFETVEVDLNDPALLGNTATVDAYIDNPFAFAIFRDFMTTEALAQSPELRQLDAAIAAQERTVLAARRALWAPTVTAGGDLTALQTAGGLDPTDVAELPFPTTRPNALNWSVGVSASLPLFTGGARRAERTRAEEELDELRLTRRAVAERVEQRLRTVLHLAGASYAGIDLAADAADAAQRNLELIADAYEQGVLSILDLIDAQNAALVAEQGAATAVYDYLIDLMDTHRASGRFGLFMDPAGLASFTDRLRAFFRDAGYEPRARP
ncbi:MAG: TolC family protein, partial [Acidobacteria bacterium]|nr:TolC family protein [Acidobacteriota bacterium]